MRVPQVGVSGVRVTPHSRSITPAPCRHGKYLNPFTGWAVDSGMTSRRKGIAIATVATLLAFAAVAVAKKDGGDAHRPAIGQSAAFAWLRAGAVPPGWITRRLPGSPARLSAPHGWRSAPGDPGTRTMVTRRPSGAIVGYLNATPRQGSESAANWSAFRVAHNREEGDRDVRQLAYAADLRFRSATGSCVLDSYRTTQGNRFREIACIVSGRSATTVIIAAAPPSHWAVQGPVLERAVSSFRT